MEAKDMMSKYDLYLNEHISGVVNAFDWMVDNLPELFSEYDSDYLGELVSMHDSSKYSEEEYLPYCAYFYGEQTDFVKDEFNKAWLHHQHENPHHWQHWLLREDDGNFIAIEMPYQYIVEMICDWWSFSWSKGNLYEIFDWYEKNKEKQLLNEKTLIIVESILEKIKNKLDENS